MTTLKSLGFIATGACLTIAIMAIANNGYPVVLTKSHAPPAKELKELPTPAAREHITRSGANALNLPANMATKMGLRTAEVQAVDEGVSLPGFQGVLALNNDRLSRVHTYFAGEVVKLGHSTDGSDPELRVGERVKRGDLLAVLWSTELGDKKNALVDSLAKLKAEEELRDRLKKLYEEGGGAGRPYRDAEKDVQTRLVEISGLERALRTWRVSEEEIAEVHADAQRLINSQPIQSDIKDWAKVEIRAPISGIVLEKNIVVGDIVGTDTDLFKIGDLSQLVVWAHVYEEDLCLLESLPKPLPWTLQVPSQPGSTFQGTLDKIGAVIDPAQHTALVSGLVENPTGHLKIGQFVTASIQLPPSTSELAVPSTAVVEDGRESIVFIQPVEGEMRFVRCPVTVVRRLKDTVYIRNTPTSAQAGDRIVASGALMLQNAMIQLPAPNESEAVAQSDLEDAPLVLNEEAG